MSNPKIDDPDRTPLDPTMELVRRKMVRTLVISIGTMCIGLIAVAGAIVYKVSSRNDVGPAPVAGSVPADAPSEARAALPAGFTVEHVGLDGNRILFYGKAADGVAHALVFDIGLGRLTADVTAGK